MEGPKRPLPTVLASLLALAHLGCSEPAALPPNLVLVTIDTARADRIGAYGHEGAQTPVLDALAARGVRFEDAIAQATTTPPSHASILTGLYPTRHGLRRLHGDRLPEAQLTLAEHLREQGYATAAFVSALPLRRKIGLHQGFDLYDDDFRRGVGREVAQSNARQTNLRVLQWLESAPDSPLFLWVHYFDPHYPYQPPPGFVTRFGLPAQAPRRQGVPKWLDDPKKRQTAPGPSMLELMSRLYDAEMAFLDSEIGVLLEALEGRELLDHAVTVVVADHGEHLGESGYFFGHWDVLDETARVPAILAHSDGRHAGRVVEGTVGTIDLVPTLLSWMDLPAMPNLDGVDLSDAIATGAAAERAIYTEQLEYFPVRAVRAGDWVLRQAAAPGEEVESGPLHLLPRGSDAAASAEASVRRELEDALARASRETVDSEGIEVSDEVRAQLEALGYTNEAAAP